MKNLKIYFTSDVHGYLYPVDYASNKPLMSGLASCAGNFKKDENTLVLDGGDMLQGSPLTYYLHRIEKNAAKVTAEVMNLAHYDYFTIGNHDFNYGVDILQDYINSMKAKCVSANVKGLNNVYDYLIFTMENGLKVGITGAVSHFVNVWEKKENLKNVKVVSPVAELERVLDIIKDQVDVTICIYHGGFEADVYSGKKLTESEENQAYRICKELGYDIVLTGHQHVPYENLCLFNTYTCQTPDKAQAYIEMDVEVKDSIKAVSALRKPETRISREIVDYLEEYQERCNTWLDLPVGHLDVELIPESSLNMALKGSYIANFFNQVQLWASNADISSTSLANEVKGFNQDVTIRDVISTYVFANTLYVLKVNRTVLKKALERSAEYFDVKENEITISESFLKPKVSHYLYDYVSGVYVTVDLNQPLGNRITSILYKGKELDDHTELTICMNNYRAGGSGGYEFYPECEIVQAGTIEIAELIMDYISTFKNITVDKTKWFEIIIKDSY